MNEKESVISELESKIRNLENDTPKSTPETQLYGNGDARTVCALQINVR